MKAAAAAHMDITQYMAYPIDLRRKGLREVIAPAATTAMERRTPDWT